MIKAETGKALYLASFEERAAADQPQWLQPIRRRAIDRFADLGFPTTRHEEWKYTNLSSLSERSFQLVPGEVGILSEEDVSLFRVDGAITLVFVNGLYAPSLSSRPNLPAGVRIVSLAEALETDSEIMASHLTRHAPFDDQAFAALNTAFIEDGAFIHVPRGVQLERPIHLLFASTVEDQAIVSHPRILVVAEAGSSVSVIEEYVGLGQAPTFTNTVTEIVAGEDAVVHHNKIEQERDESTHIAARHIHQSRGSNVSSNTITLGGGLVRNNIDALLDGEHAACFLGGLYLLHGSRHADNHLRVDHAKPNCQSREYFKGVLHDASRGVFTGRIIVREDAQKTDAQQTNKNLILSDAASADARPQLEIFADDVKCSHGATVGRIDEEALFYLRSRGLNEEAARSLMIYAFACESLSEIKIEPLRRRLQRLVADLLPHGDVIRNHV